MTKQVLTIYTMLLATCIWPPACLEAQEQVQAGAVLLDSFEAVYPYLGKDHVKVKVKPGRYEIDAVNAEPMLAFTGSDCSYDFTDVTLAIKQRPCNAVIGLIGNRITLRGLRLETPAISEKCTKGLNTVGINITGDNNTLLNVTILIRDSHPFGYGSSFGIGKGALVSPTKGNGIRVGPADQTLIKGCTVIMHAFGHGIFIRGGDQTTIEDTVVEGMLRQTNEMLQEKEGVGIEQGFIDWHGQIIRPGKITSLPEDGIRIYPDSGTSRNYNKPTNRKTGRVTLKNCTVKRMRRGICLALGGSNHRVTGCTVIECTRVGYNIGSHTTLKDCQGDAKYCQLLEIQSSASRDCDVELSVLDSRQRQGNIFNNDPDLLAKINGTNHRVRIETAAAENVPSAMTIELGGNVGREISEQEDYRGARIQLVNETAAWVLLHPGAEDCYVRSVGPVVDYGHKNNRIVQMPSQN